VRQAKDCFAREDYAGAVKTGIVTKRKRAIRTKDGKGFEHVEDYEINSPLIEAYNSIERRAAIETGQEVDRQDINLRGGKLNANQELLVKAYADDPLRLEAIIEEMRAKMLAVAQAEEHGKVVDALPDENENSQQPTTAAKEALVKSGSAKGNQQLSPASGKPLTGTATGEVVPSAPEAPRSWRG
jgi:hypothetical protein